MKYHKNQVVGMFDGEFTLQELPAQGNPLPKLKEMIDFELFRNILEPVFEPADRKSDAGRKPLDPVLFFLRLRLSKRPLAVSSCSRYCSRGDSTA